MEAEPQRPEDMVAESKLPTSPVAEPISSSKGTNDSETGLVTANDSAVATNNQVPASSSTLNLPSPPDESSNPPVNGISRQDGLVNGNHTTATPTLTESPSMNSATDPPSHLAQPGNTSLHTAQPVSDPAPPVSQISSSTPDQPVETPPVKMDTDTNAISEPAVASSEQPSNSEPPVTSPDAPVLAPDPIASLETPAPLPLSQPIAQDTSNLREGAEPTSVDVAETIKEQKGQADLAADPELAQGLQAGSTAPIDRSLSSEPKPDPPSAGAEDKMDVAQDPAVDQAETAADLPHRPQSTSDEAVSQTAAPAEPAALPATTADVQADSEMIDAPSTGTKVAREREDDTQEEERAAKRSKTDEVEPNAAEFKVPELPQSRSKENGVVGDRTAVDTSQPMTSLQQKYLQKSLVPLRRQNDSKAFNIPVDPVKLNIPTYFDVIKSPMDLSTIERKLKSNSYKTVDEVTADVDLMVSNTVTFNGPEHAITQSGLKVRAAFGSILERLPSASETEPSAAEKKAKKAAAAASTKVNTARRESRSAAPNARSPATNAGSPSGQTFALRPEGVPLIRRDSMAADGRPKREIHPPKKNSLEYGPRKPVKKKYRLELDFCKMVLDELFKPKYSHIAQVFYYPVDPVALNIPTYHKIIKKPMDLSTIRENLNAGQYENAREFESDIRLMFQNCYKFNTPGDVVYTMGKSLEGEFDREWERKAKWISDNAPSGSGPQSQGTSPEPDEDGDDGEEEEEEEDNDPDNEIATLQKQMAMMSKKIETLSKQKTSPPAAKKTKNKTAKKEKKPTGATSGSKKKDSGKSKKSEKIPYVTYDQKKLISDRINDLSEAKMGQALRIIRDNVPHLKDVNEEEIELDIDELPNDVLFRLLQFVRSATGSVDDDDAPKKKAAPAAPTKPKKNKPMGKQEQEAKISSIQAQLNSFENRGAEDPNAMKSIEHGESSSDDEDESEEE